MTDEITVKHSDLVPGAESGIHVAQRWRVANAAARTALVVSSIDVGGFCLQDDLNQLWRLSDYSPVVWTLVGTGDAFGPASAVVGNLATFSNVDGKHLQDSSVALTALATKTYADTGAAATLVTAEAYTDALASSTTTALALKADASATTSALAGKASTATSVVAGAGLTGGGTLAADRTVNVVANADGSIVVNADDIQVGVITDAQHGTRAGGTTHPAAVDGGASGFMTGAQSLKLTGIAAGATVAPALSSTTPAAVGTAAIGVGTTTARADHVHAHGNQLGGALHAQVTGSVDGFMIAADKTKLDGVAAGATVAPSLSSTTPADVGTAAIGAGTTTARADHVHNHGTQLGGTLHANASGSAAGFMSSSDFTKLSGVAASAAALTASSPAAVDTAAAVVGVATDAARADHKHAVTVAVPVSTGTANAAGSSTSLSRADHVHDATALLSNATPSAPGSASAGVATSATRSDHVHPADPQTATNTSAIAAKPSLTANTPQAVGTAAVGTGTAAARDDHVHAHGNQLGGTLHAVATGSTAGFMSASDKAKLDGIQTVRTTADLTTTLATLSDVTPSSGPALAFAVTAGVTYRFKFGCVWQNSITAAATQFSVNGPAASMIVFNSLSPGSSTIASTFKAAFAYDTTPTITATPNAATDFLSVIEGMFTPTVSGTLTARFRNNTVTGAPVGTARAGSWGELLAI